MTPSHLAPWRVLWLLLPLGGCFIVRPSLDGTQDSDDGSSAETVPSDDAGDTGFSADTRWGVSGTLVIVDELPDVGASRLRLQTRGVECSVAATLQTAVPVASPPEDVDFAWTLEVMAEPGDTCTWRGPTTFVVGVGRSDPQLRPAADRAGIAWDGASGFYLGTPGDPLFLVGLARPVHPPPADTDVGDTEPSETDLGDTDDTDDVGAGLADTGSLPTVFDLATLHGIPLSR